MDPGYEPSELESRTIFGLKLEQLRNNARIDESVFTNIVSKRQDVSNFIQLSVSWQMLLFIVIVALKNCLDYIFAKYSADKQIYILDHGLSF